MDILATVILFSKDLPITGNFQTGQKDGDTFLLHPISDEKFLAIRLHPDRILPPHQGQEFQNYLGTVGPDDHQAILLSLDDFD